MSQVSKLLSAGGTAEFDVVNEVPWHSLYWAGGPLMLALGLSDNANVSTIPDEMGTAADDLDAVHTPSSACDWRSSGTYTSNPCWEFNGATNIAFESGPWSKGDILDADTSYSIIVIGASAEFTDTTYNNWYSSPDSSYGVTLRTRQSTDYWRFSAGSSYSTYSGWPTVEDTSHVVATHVRTTASSFDHTQVDGANVIVNHDDGSSAMSELRLGSGYSGAYPFQGELCLWGVLEGDIFSDFDGTWFPAFDDWVFETFGNRVD